MFDWRRPTNLGVKDGRLAPCKRSPNCVSSQADPLDKEHYVAPISYAGSIAELRKALATLNLATVIREEPDYLYAEFRTPFLRFVDDVEFLKDGEVLHVRSASRLGRRDFKANRRRVEQLRAFLRQAP
ncbi:MAG: hypothetical protein K0R40_812 [Burkholderiales bacterium]|nr:hypothetical protein [Burkholderiales bacterium]